MTFQKPCHYSKNTNIFFSKVTSTVTSLNSNDMVPLFLMHRQHNKTRKNPENVNSRTQWEGEVDCLLMRENVNIRDVWRISSSPTGHQHHLEHEPGSGVKEALDFELIRCTAKAQGWRMNRPSSAKSIQLLVLTNHNTSDGIYWHMLNHTQRTLLLIKMSQPSDLVEEKKWTTLFCLQ